MRRIKNVPLLFAFLVTVIFACNNDQAATTVEGEIKKDSPSVKSKSVVFDNILGVWKNYERKIFEQWTEVPGKGYASKVYKVTNGDTAYEEDATIYFENGKWVFENKVSGQNNGAAIKFIADIITDSSVQFSNPAHDFPTDINYTLVDKSNLHAFIVGPNKNNGKDTIPYNYVRVK